MTEPRSEVERQRLFRQMRWVYVYLPPVLLIISASVAALIIALVTAEVGFTFRERFAGSAVLMAAATGIMLGIQRRSNR